MNTYRYKVGQDVRLTNTNGSRLSRTLPGGAFRIVRHLPSSQSGESQYRIKSTTDSHERVVVEAEIEAL